jgi:hypothetical protein
MMMSPKQGGVVMPLLNDRDLAYYGNMTFGTPSQPFCLSIDTGSSDTWVVSLQNNPDKSQYNSWESSTFRATPYTPAELYYVSISFLLSAHDHLSSSIIAKDVRLT